ncbi:ubiquinone anaerobic biosynthesis accessory factor UbiT [Solemya velum gill symbiont]|nr:SCP2 sterol-binding domain-containing protein [Solemya velum gill symbiont]OOY49573.1 hypothetical protein BOV94_10205 [Solemya velum gill symbiont]OOY70991.1 hypothetical protein BOW08_11325 [Solemya velum gill symbiont]OOY84941.1 hypothetical protein BOW13_06575 [Solemya velum gill symbiont]OOY98174.1 hypothetical protein BOW19_10185 [Solemya velum gill symbiont]
MLHRLIRRLPRPPQAPARFMLEQFLNKIFATAIAEEELDFLNDNVFQVRVDGIPMEFDLTLKNDKLKLSHVSDQWDLRITGSAYDFMLLAARREDADTLFFQRRITTEGDTELGLYLKNFLDSLDLSDLPFSKWLEQGLNGAIAMHDRFEPLGRALQR